MRGVRIGADFWNREGQADIQSLWIKREAHILYFSKIYMYFTKI